MGWTSHGFEGTWWPSAQYSKSMKESRSKKGRVRVRDGRLGQRHRQQSNHEGLVCQARNFILKSSQWKVSSGMRQLDLCCCPPKQTVRFSSVQSLSHVWLFETLWTTARQASLSITNSWSLIKLISIESVMPCNHLILCCPLLLPPSIFPRERTYSFQKTTFVTKYFQNSCVQYRPEEIISELVIYLMFLKQWKWTSKICLFAFYVLANAWMKILIVTPKHIYIYIYIYIYIHFGDNSIAIDLTSTLCCSSPPGLLWLFITKSSLNNNINRVF